VKYGVQDIGLQQDACLQQAPRRVLSFADQRASGPATAAPPEVRRLAERVEWHYTPKHGSWLDLAESELGVLSTQCLDRRIPDKQTLIDEVAA
jgi:hypothetical protein